MVLWWFPGCFGGFQGALVVSRVLRWFLWCFGGFQGALVVSRVLWWFPGCFGRLWMITAVSHLLRSGHTVLLNTSHDLLQSDYFIQQIFTGILWDLEVCCWLVIRGRIQSLKRLRVYQRAQMFVLVFLFNIQRWTMAALCLTFTHIPTQLIAVC